jgi:hypothetical protein
MTESGVYLQSVCAMCRRSRDGLDAWFAVVSYAPVGDDEWAETRRIGVCSWSCLRLAYMAEEPGEPSDPEAWKGEGRGSLPLAGREPAEGAGHAGTIR